MPYLHFWNPESSEIWLVFYKHGVNSLGNKTQPVLKWGCLGNLCLFHLLRIFVCFAEEMLKHWTMGSCPRFCWGVCNILRKVVNYSLSKISMSMNSCNMYAFQKFEARKLESGLEWILCPKDWNYVWYGWGQGTSFSRRGDVPQVAGKWADTEASRTGTGWEGESVVRICQSSLCLIPVTASGVMEFFKWSF